MTETHSCQCHLIKRHYLYLSMKVHTSFLYLNTSWELTLDLWKSESFVHAEERILLMILTSKLWRSQNNVCHDISCSSLLFSRSEHHAVKCRFYLLDLVIMKLCYQSSSSLMYSWNMIIAKQVRVQIWDFKVKIADSMSHSNTWVIFLKPNHVT